MVLPSSAAGAVTEEVGYLHAPLPGVVPWMHEGLGNGWEVQTASWTSLEEAATYLAPTDVFSRQAAIPVGEWTLVLTNGPTGTDVGLLPSHAARDLGCRAVRTVYGDGTYPARILDVFGPDGRQPLLSRRSIACANDGGTWIFETSGPPFGFERVEEYDGRPKSSRFPADMLYDYLRQLGVPIDAEPDWASSQVLELRE